MVDIGRKLSTRPVDKEGLLEFVNKELIPVVERIRLALLETAGGDVVGPDGATTGNLATFADATGKIISDSGFSIAQILSATGDVFGPASAVDGNFASFDGVTGKLIGDSGYGPAGLLLSDVLDAFFGSGSDGDLTASSGTTTLTKPTFYDEVTLTGTAQINTAGYPLFIRRFNAEGAPERAIYRAGGNAVGTTNQGKIVDTIVLGGGGAGAQGGAGGGLNTNGTGGGAYPSTLAVGNGGIGGTGGTGGNSATGKTGGAGTTGTFPTAFSTQQGLGSVSPIPSNSTGTTWVVIGGGQGGGGGGGGGGGAVGGGGFGGGAGSGGATLEVWIGELVTGPSTPAALIDSYGGSGSNQSSGPGADGGGGAGGGGGGGGYTRCFIGKRTGDPVTNLVCARGGPGGNGGSGNGGGTAGTGGAAGGGGEVLVVVLSTGEVQFKAREGQDVDPVGATGGVPTVWGLAA